MTECFKVEEQMCKLTFNKLMLLYRQGWHMHTIQLLLQPLF